MCPQNETYTLQDAINEIGFGMGQVTLLMITGSVFAADAMEILMISFIMPYVRSEFNLSGWETSLLASGVFVGMLLGALPTGILSDKFGRKKIIQLWIFIGIIFGFASAVAFNFWFMLITRCMVGFSIAGASHLSFSLFAECLPSQNRGFWMMIFTLSWAIGSIIEALLAWYIIPHYGWRWLVVATAVPLIFSFLSIPFVGESPKYFLASQNLEKAIISLDILAKRNGKALPNGTLINDMKEEKLGNLRDLFPNLIYTRLTLLVVSIWMLCSFIYYGVVLLIPDYLSSDNDSAYLGSLLAAASEFPGYLVAGLLVDRIGRIRSLYISFAIFFLSVGLYMFYVSRATTHHCRNNTTHKL